MNRIILFLLSLIAIAPAEAQVLSLDSCRAMALRANKQVSMARAKKDIATNTRKAARTKYLPHVDIAGGYMYSTRSVSILNDDQKYAIGNIGTIGMNALGEKAGQLPGVLSNAIEAALKRQEGKIPEKVLTGLGNIVNDMKNVFGPLGQELAADLANIGDAMGQRLVDAFNTNTHHIFMASATLTQPVYMGGAITAANKMADISEHMAETNIEAKQHDVLYSIDNAYWLVVSLKHKQRLAEDYLGLVSKLNDDVHKMIASGVATRADGLKVDVALNEAEMAKTKVDNGLSLSRMLLCQLCGIDLNSPIILADEDKDDLGVELADDYGSSDVSNRPELQLLQDAIDLTKQQTKMARAGILPQVALTTGTMFSSPSVYNGFERKFKGAFNVGVMVRIPVLDWGETTYKIRASKGATRMAQLQYDDAQEMMNLQVSQCSFKIREANKNLVAARKNILSAEENLRCATLGFKEGVMQTTDVMAAQTAWLQAQTQKVDAEIDLKLSEASMKKALGRF